MYELEDKSAGDSGRVTEDESERMTEAGSERASGDGLEDASARASGRESGNDPEDEFERAPRDDSRTFAGMTDAKLSRRWLCKLDLSIET